MKSFGFIPSRTNHHLNSLMLQSIKKKKLKLITIDDQHISFLDILNISPDMLYRASTHPRAKIIEQEVISDTTATFYSKNQKSYPIFNKIYQEILFSKYNIPTPKTIRDVPTNKKMLSNYVDYLGGFPIIIKQLGKSHSDGIIKIDSLDSLFSTAQVLNSNMISDLTMKQWIHKPKHARLIVLNEQVIDSIEYQAPSTDFRTNARKNPSVSPQKFSKEINTTAVKAVKCVGLEFGGVDILTNNQEQFVIEVNFPCNFARAQNITKTDISGKIVSYLYQKSSNSS